MHESKKFADDFQQMMSQIAFVSSYYHLCPPIVVFGPEWKPPILQSSGDWAAVNRGQTCCNVLFEFGTIKMGRVIS